MTLRDAIARAAARLSPSSETARLDAELLAAHALGTSREAMLLGRLDEAAPAGFDTLVDRRATGEPIAYILGSRDFWTISLAVAPGVLIPRPDSETLIEEAVRHFVDRAPVSVLDLGTGSGALLLAALAEWSRADGLGIDRADVALAIARENARLLGMADRACFELGDWASAIDRRFDLILCNPPYIEDAAVLPRDVADHEPAGALFAGADGLDAYRVLAPQVSRLLMPGGIALFEIGFDQADAVSTLFRAQGHMPRVLRDLAGHSRCIAIDDRASSVA